MCGSPLPPLSVTTGCTSLASPRASSLPTQANFRGSLSLEHEATQIAYDELNQAASDLCTAIKEDLPNAAQVSDHSARGAVVRMAGGEI